MIKVGHKTDKGKKRELNEDFYMVIPEHGLYIVADGVGGNTAGDVASKTAVEEIVKYLEIDPIEKIPNGDELDKYFDKCLSDANDTVYALGKKQPEISGLATTLVMCYIRGGIALFVNVGDSRGYIYRKGELLKVTEDHSYVNSLVKLGVLSEQEAEVHAKGNVITRAIGAEREIEGDIYEVDLLDGDIIILCTDGLYHEVHEEEMQKLLNSEDDMQILADKMVDMANENGGRDNITVVNIKIMGGN